MSETSAATALRMRNELKDCKTSEEYRGFITTWVAYADSHRDSSDAKVVKGMIERAQAKLTGLSNNRVAALPLPPNNETPAAIAPIKAMENASTAVMPRRVPPDGKTIREHTTDVQMSEELSTSETHGVDSASGPWTIGPLQAVGTKLIGAKAGISVLDQLPLHVRTEPDIRVIPGSAGAPEDRATDLGRLARAVQAAAAAHEKMLEDCATSRLEFDRAVLHFEQASALQRAAIFKHMAR